MDSDEQGSMEPKSTEPVKRTRKKKVSQVVYLICAFYSPSLYLQNADPDVSQVSAQEIRDMATKFWCRLNQGEASLVGRKLHQATMYVQDIF